MSEENILRYTDLAAVIPQQVVRSVIQQCGL
jgi:hypothetical protein